MRNVASVVAGGMLLVAGCVPLEKVSRFATASSEGLSGYTELGYGFAAYCREGCILEAIRKAEVRRDPDCLCGGYENSDRAVHAIYRSLYGYFSGLARLASGKTAAYTLDPLRKALGDEAYEGIQIDQRQVDAYSSITETMLNASTRAYRRKKITDYLSAANEPVVILLEKLVFILRNNLEDELKFRKEKLYVRYNELVLYQGISAYEKEVAMTMYYRLWDEAEGRRRKIEAFIPVLLKIVEGHRKLNENKDKLTTRELNDYLLRTTSDLQDLVSAYHKLGY